MTSTLDSEQATINAIFRCAVEAYRRGDNELGDGLTDAAVRMQTHHDGTAHPPAPATLLTEDVAAGSTIRVEHGRIVIDRPSEGT